MNRTISSSLGSLLIVGAIMQEVLLVVVSRSTSQCFYTLWLHLILAPQVLERCEEVNQRI